MDPSVQAVQATLDEVEQTAEMVQFSIKTFVGTLKQFLDLLGEHGGGQELPVAGLECFAHVLTRVGEDLAEAGNQTLSRLAGARDAGHPIPPCAHHHASEPPTQARGSSPS